jgi:transcriptional regulator with XRE-family HTH domain
MRHLNVIGPQIRKLRYRQRWSQNDLAIKLQLIGWDITRSTVAKIESRLMWVGDWQLFYFTRVFKVELQDLFPPLDPHETKMHDRLMKLLNSRW